MKYSNMKQTWKHKVRESRVAGDAAFIKLQNGLEAIVDSEDLHKVRDWNWFCRMRNGKPITITRGDHRGGINRCVYIYHEILGVPNQTFIDHIDCNPLNNRKSNLRIADIKSNARNRSIAKNNTSGYKGVTLRADRGTWQAQIGVDGVAVKLGTFKTAEEAARAYDKKAIEAYGTFAKTNFPQEQYC